MHLRSPSIDSTSFAAWSPDSMVQGILVKSWGDIRLEPKDMVDFKTHLLFKILISETVRAPSLTFSFISCLLLKHICLF